MYTCRKAALLFVLTFIATAFGRPAHCQIEKTPTWIEIPDDRLNQKYTIRAPRVQVGELFEYVGRDAGIDIRCTEVTADPEISVFVVKKSVGDLMDAIRSLFSQRGAEWIWRQDSDNNGRKSYTLFRSVSAKKLCAEIADRVQQQFESEAEAEIDWLNGNAAKRNAIEKRYPFMKSLMDSPNIRCGMGVFGNHFSPEDRKGIYRGDSLIVTMEQLSPEERSWVQGRWDSVFQTSPDKVGSSPSELTVRTETRDLGAPSLLISLDAARGTVYVGGVPTMEKFIGEETAAWAYDSNNQPLDNLTVIGPIRNTEEDPLYLGAARTKSLDARSNRLEQRLEAVARGAGEDIIAEFRIENISKTAPIPTGMKVSEFNSELANCVAGLSIMRKVRQGITLYRDAAWYLRSPDDGWVPWQSVKAWRHALTTVEGIMTIKELEALRKLNSKQAERIGQEFPEAALEWDPSLFFSFWSRLQSLQKTAAMSSRGLVLSSLPREALLQLTPEPEEITRGVLKVTALRLSTPDPLAKYINGLKVQMRLEDTTQPTKYVTVLSRWREPSLRDIVVKAEAANAAK